MASEQKEDAAAIPKLAGTFQDVAVAAKMTSDFLLAIAADPEWTWPIRTVGHIDCSISFKSNGGRLVCVETRVNGYSSTVFARRRERYSSKDLAEFCKHLKAALQQW